MKRARGPSPVLLGLLMLAAWCSAARAAEGEPEAEAEAEAEEDEKEPVLTIPQDDRRAGEEGSEEVEQILGLLAESELTKYVDEVGQRLARNAPRTFDYTFRVVDQEVPNAFALPGGFVFVSRGLLLLANNEDELANVLGHEIVHVASRHAAARQHIVKGVPGIFQFMQMGSLAAYGREQERIADRLGQGLAGLAGYDPYGMASFMKSLNFSERLTLGASRLPSFRDTHPSSGERVGASADRAGRIAWERRPAIAASREEYLERIDGLAVGISASEGVFRGDRFLHPDLGFTVRFPTGWQTQNTHTAVAAVSPDRSASLVLEGGGKPPLEEAARKYVEKSAREGLKVHAVERIVLAGEPALRARGSAAGLHVIIHWVQFRDSIYRLSGASLSRHHEGIILNFARSFRPLPPELLDTITETRLRIARARAGETLGQLSQRTGNVWDLQTTSVMNGVFTGEALQEGQALKIALEEPYRPRER